MYTLTRKGQLTIPQAIRKALGLRPGAPVLVNVVSLESRHATLQLAPANSPPRGHDHTYESTELSQMSKPHLDQPPFEIIG